MIASALHVSNQQFPGSAKSLWHLVIHRLFRNWFYCRFCTAIVFRQHRITGHRAR